MTGITRITVRSPAIPLLAGVLVLLAALPFLASPKNGFTNWDDTGYVTANDTIRSLSPESLAGLLTTPQMGNWHPLTMLSYALQYRLFGASAAGYHAVSLALHLGCVLLLFLLLFRWVGDRGGAFAGALLFGVHPLRVEPVAWVSGQKELLCAFFFLLAFLLWEKAGAGCSPRILRGLSLAAFALALMAKPMAVTLPLVFLLRDRSVTGRRRLSPWWYAAFLALAAGVTLATLLAQQESVRRGTVFPPYEGVFVAAHGALFYLAKTLLPVGLAALYPYPDRVAGHLPWPYLLSPAILAALLWLSWRSLRDYPLARFGVIFFIVTLLPASQIVPVGYAHAADRYTYLPSVGLALLAALGLGWLARRGANISPAARRLPWALVALVVAASAAVTLQRVPVWHDSLTLWSDVLERFPGDPVALTNRGGALNEGRQFAAALDDLDGALLRGEKARAYYRHGFGVLHFNRAVALAALGRNEEAYAGYSQALAIEPASADAWGNRGALLDTANRFEEAIADYDRALALRPDNALYLVNRCLANLNRNQPAAALPDCSRAALLDPANGRTRYLLGQALQRLGREEEALGEYDEALQLNPFDERALLERGRLRRRAGDGGGALEDLDRVLAGGSPPADAWFERGTLRLTGGDPAGAATDLSRALELDPAMVEAWNNRGTARATLGDLPGAVSDFNRALALRPDHAGAAANLRRAMGRLHAPRS